MYRRFLSVRYLKTRLVNFLSIGGVMMGVAVMIVVTSVADGFQAEVRSVVRGTLSHLIFEPTGALRAPDGAQVADPAFAEVEAALKADPDVAAVAAQVVSYVVHPYASAARRDGTSEFFLVQVVGIDWQRETGVVPAREGESPAEREARLGKEQAASVSNLAQTLLAVGNRANPFDDKAAKDREQKTAIFSKSFLDSFSRKPVPEGEEAKYLGQTVEILTFTQKINAVSGETEYKPATRQIRVVGVYQARDQGSDQQRIYMAREDVREIANIALEYTEIRVALKDYEVVNAAKPRLLARLSVKDPTTGALVSPFRGRTWEEAQQAMVRALNSEKAMLLIVLSFIVVLACFTILATLTLTVVEKTRDIGVVRALGATTGGVLSIFLRGGLLMGTIGGLLGLGLGLLAANHVNGIKAGLASLGIHLLDAEVSMFREIPVRIDPFQVGCIVAGSIVVSFLAGLLPALRASRMDPVVALRHE